VVEKRLMQAPPERAASLAADLAATHALSRRTLSMKNAAPVSFPTNHITTTRRELFGAIDTILGDLPVGFPNNHFTTTRQQKRNV